MDRPKERSPALVSTGGGRQRQAGEVRPRRREDGPWAWTEPSVWTGRMLTALENGVKGGVWFSLIDKVWSPKNLGSSFAKVKANDGAAGVDHQTIAMFERDLESNLHRIRQQLESGTYEPQAVRRHHIPKGGGGEKRPLGIPTVRDRVVQGALRHVLEPIFERDFAERSYGFRPGRGCKDALRRVDALLEAGFTHVVDADLKSYFDTIPHARLLERVKAKIADGRVLALIEAYLNQDVMDGLERWTPEAGTPQGAILSPLLANIYLDPLDHVMAGLGIEMIRYADDFVILTRTASEAQSALATIRTWCAESGLTLHPDKTRVLDAQHDGFDFLGYRFQKGRHWPRDKSLKKLRDAVRAQTHRRTSGCSLSVIILRLNPILRGWYEYFQHSTPWTFVEVDGWVRMRLRSLLRARRGGEGRGRGADHQRWPNAYFAEQGLFCLTTAHARPRQSVTR